MPYRVGGGVTPAVLPHHRTCGSAPPPNECALPGAPINTGRAVSGPACVSPIVCQLRILSPELHRLCATNRTCHELATPVLILSCAAGDKGRIISPRRRTMQKAKVNITLDKDLIEFAKFYAEEQRTTVSEIVGQFILNLKRTKDNDPTEAVLSDPDFTNSLLDTLSEIRSGKMKWHTYDEVFQ